MSIEERTVFPTNPVLRQFVQSFWILRGHAGTKPYLLPTEPYFDIILSFGDDTNVVHANGRREYIAGSFIGGIRTGPFLLSPVGSIDYLAVRFYPHGLRPFLDMQCSAVTDAFVALDIIRGRLLEALQPAIYEFLPSEGRIRSIEQALTGMLKHSSVFPSKGLIESLSLIGSCSGSEKIASVCRQIGSTERQLHREFERFLGVSPKQYSRIVRFSSLLMRLNKRSIQDGFSALAYDCGYTDQSHMIHECLEFTGLTPSSLLAEYASAG